MQKNYYEMLRHNTFNRKDELYPSLEQEVIEKEPEQEHYKWLEGVN